MPVQIEIDGVIGWDVIPSDISNQLKKANGEDVEILFSSGGGFISDGLAIFNHIHDYQGKTTAIIIGMAASMASYIPLAADKVIAKSNAVYMIHDALMGIYGNQKELEKGAAILGGFSNLLADIYVKKTGKTLDEIRDLMRDETYFFGSEMLEAGFVDEIEDIEVGDKSKDDIVLDAMLKAEMITDKMKVKPENYNKIAAILKPAAKEQSPGTESPAKRASAESKNPKEEKVMDLTQFLAENPEAKKEHDTLVIAAEKKGADSVQARVDRVSPFLNGPYKEQAAKVLSGEASAEMFEMAASMMDAGVEAKKADDADGEQEKDTPAGKQEKSTDGILRTDEDEAAAIAKLRGA